jgi:predicted alpha/beta-hydrolase family hydrolase
VAEGIGEVSALLLRPRDARALLVFAHGAGAGMRHAFMEDLSQRLAGHRVASFRFQFPYMEQGRRRPDRRPALLATLRAAIATAGEEAGDLPLWAGGKSMGGRMTSLAAAEAKLPEVRGLVFFGFPLHAAGRPGSERGEHLARVELPMLFLQGTRDRLADLSLLGPLCRELGERATLQVVEGGDHSFHVLKRSGRSDDEVLAELAETVASWTGDLDARSAPTRAAPTPATP